MALPVLVFTGGAALSAWFFYRRKLTAAPELIFKPSPLLNSVVARCPALTQPMIATPYLLGGHATTVFASLFRKSLGTKYRRESLTTDDGGMVSVDWLDCETETAATKSEGEHPILILLHGLTGNSESDYVQHLARAASRLGFHVAVLNNRGSGGQPLRTPKAYSASFTGDIRLLVSTVATRFPRAPLYGVGVSLGSIILVKYLAEAGSSCPLRGAMSISNPWCLHSSTASLETPVSRLLYNSRLTKGLQKLISCNETVFAQQDQISVHDAMAARTIREFDAAVICPMFGYSNVEEYYDDASSSNHVDRVRVPTLFLNAVDDPFAPVQGIPRDKVLANENILVALTACGGHVAFCQGWYPVEESYMEDVLVQFLSALEAARVEGSQPGTDH